MYITFFFLLCKFFLRKNYTYNSLLYCADLGIGACIAIMVRTSLLLCSVSV